jgi:uracil-DNA glycosylase
MESEPQDATPFLPERRTLADLRAAAATCRGCELGCHATQTVFGDGPEHARVMMVGEVPGEREDREGRPFVGPAGLELDKGLDAAGIDRGDVYVTNVVKHFKFDQRGKRRIHQRPNANEINACAPWLQAELEAIRPDALIILGATAGKALFDRTFRLTPNRGRALDAAELAPVVVATSHPSAILRAPDDAGRDQARHAFIDDLRVAAELIAGQRIAALSR